MSMKGKVKTYPAFYQTASQSSLDFGEEGNPRHKVEVSNLLPFVGNSVESILTNIPANSLILSPYTRLIPLFYLRFGQNLSPIIGGRQPQIEEFYRNLARRELNGFMANNEIFDSVTQEKIRGFATSLGRIKREKWSKTVMGRALSDYQAQTHSSGAEVMKDFAKKYITMDLPLVINQHTIGYGGAFSRDQMMNSFSTVGISPARFSQRTYNGILDLLTMFYSSGLPGVRNSNELMPAVMGVMTAETMVYQKLHWILTGTFDLSKITVLVDRELDNPRFPINGMREFYYKNLQPWMVDMGLNIWKVPRVFMEDYCIHQEQIPRTGGLLQYKQRCNTLLDKVYSTVGNLYRGEREPLVPAIIETVQAVDITPEMADFFETAVRQVEDEQPAVRQPEPVQQVEDAFDDLFGTPDQDEMELEEDEEVIREEEFDEEEELEQAAVAEHPEISADDWFARAQDLAENLEVEEAPRPVQAAPVRESSDRPIDWNRLFTNLDDSSELSF